VDGARRQATQPFGLTTLIPAFAVDRTEVLLHHLADLAHAGRLPAGVPVYVDSPMALSALRVYRDALERGDPDIRSVVGRGDPFDVPGLQEVLDVEGSKALNHPATPSIIISASGMASGGRVVHHLAHLCPDSRNTVVLVGYQAEGTRGRLLVDGARELKMLGRYVRVRDGGRPPSILGPRRRRRAARLGRCGASRARQRLRRTRRTGEVVPRLVEVRWRSPA
jgi:metallo-beta-lactamase family protein